MVLAGFQRGRRWEWPGKGKGMTRGPPWVELGPEMGWGRRRRARTAEPGSGGRCGLNSGEGAARPGQQATQRARVRSKGEVRDTTRLRV
jgi:hypothetical protein